MRVLILKTFTLLLHSFYYINFSKLLHYFYISFTTLILLNFYITTKNDRPSTLTNTADCSRSRTSHLKEDVRGERGRGREGAERERGRGGEGQRGRGGGRGERGERMDNTWQEI